MALDNCPAAIPKRTSGPRRPMKARFSLSIILWRQLSVLVGAFGRVDTQQHRTIVTPQLQRMSIVPRSFPEEYHPTRTSAVLLVDEDAVAELPISCLSVGDMAMSRA